MIAQNVVHRGIFVPFQILLSLDVFSNWSQVVDSQRLKGAVRFGPFGLRSITKEVAITDARTIRCLPGRHCQMGFLAFLTF